MNLCASFTDKWRFARVGLIILGLCCPFAALSQNTFSGGVAGDAMVTSPADEKNTLTLRDAIKLALQRNPDLAAFDKEVLALGGATLQAGLFRNPELDVVTEDVGSPVRPEPVVQQFVTMRLSQLIELGGKRAARVNAASLGEELARKDYEARRLDLITMVANFFTDVLTGQERVRLAEDSIHLAQKVVDSTSKRVQTGKAPPLEETKAKMALSTTGIELELARRDLIAARKQLSLLWANPLPKFDKVTGYLESSILLPSYEELSRRVLNSPMALRSAKNVEQRKALLEVENTRQVPDLIVNAAVRRYLQTDNVTALAGFTIPLPLFNRNQGSIREAHQRLDKAIDEQMATDLRLNALLSKTYEALLGAQNEIKVLREDVLPGAKSAFNVASIGYELGKFSFLEMLDAQRTLFQNQLLYVRSLAAHQKLLNEIERLIGGAIDGQSPVDRADQNLQE
ncbi:MAG TPA: TolC family protein [Nitrosospira sp.]|nr:TolC family protein [Nitrosospira sp.]